MLSITDQDRKVITPFEYIYFFMIVIYSAMATGFTSSMIGYFKHPVGFLLPIIMTVILASRNKIDFANKKLFVIFISLGIWTLLQYFKTSQYNITYTFFLFYNITIAYQ
jgi:hypothetical protein